MKPFKGELIIFFASGNNATVYHVFGDYVRYKGRV